MGTKRSGAWKHALLATSTLGWVVTPASGQEASLPQGGDVVSGAANLNYSSPGALIVDQSSTSAIINWSSFDIAAGQSVVFNQPGSSSATLNRVTGSARSVLAGALSAPGLVMLVNPNGVAITQGAVVNAGSFVASSLDIADADFLAGHYTFRRGARSGVVTNLGSVRVSEGGSLALIGAGVVNEGLLEARLGRVALGAGDVVTLDFAGDGFLSVGVPVSELGNWTDASGRPLSSLISAGGSVSADGGSIYISASGAASLMLRTVNVPGELIARSISRDQLGRISLDAHDGALQLTGSVNASGVDGADGGAIELQAGSVTMGGRLDAEGANGGAIRISAAQNLTLAGSSTARGAAGAGGSIFFNAGARILENTSGATDASGASNGGSISVTGGSVLSSGSYSARGAAGAGGDIDMSGDALSLLSAHFDASGAARGGDVRIGGALQGGAGLRRADTAFLNDGVTIDVSSSLGAGGGAVVWSDTQTTMLGAVDARGAGGGGLVEVSSAGTLRTVDIARIQAGTILLDPTNIVIGDSVAAQGWSYAGILDSSAAPIGGNDDFGVAIALNAAGDRLAVGAFLDDGADDLATDSGAVHMFTFTDANFGGSAYSGSIGSGYVGAGNVDVPLDGFDRFGVGLSLNGAGDRMAVGARSDDGLDNTLSGSGAVYLLTFSNTNFAGGSVVGRVGAGYTGGANVDIAAQLDSGDLIGNSISLNAAGDRLAIGAPFDDGVLDDFGDAGAVHLITFSNASFAGGAYAGTIGHGYAGGASYDLGEDQTDNDQFGTSVALNGAGDRLAAGAIRDDGPTDAIDQSGSVRLFTFTNTSFAGPSLAGTIGAGYSGGNNVDIANLQTDDSLGISLSFNTLGDLIAIGATGDDGASDGLSNAGAVRLVRFTDADFSGGALVATIGAGYAGSENLAVPGLAAGNAFGRSVSLNGAGDRLAVGALGITNTGSALLFSATPTTLGNLYFADSAASTINVSRAALASTLSAGTSVILQASNDITLNGVLTVNNAGGDGGNLTLQAGRSVLLNAAVSTDNGNLSITANETLAAGVVNANRSAGGGGISVASISAGGGSVRLTVNTGAGVANGQGGDIVLGPVSAGSVIVENLAAGVAGDIIFNGAIDANAGATPIVIAAGAGDVINNVGAGALNPGAGRYLIYASGPGAITANGLSANPYYNTSYNPAAPTALSAAGNRFVYTLAPVLSVTAGNTGRIYGAADPSTSYTITGLIGADTLAGAVQGAPTLTIDAPLTAGVGEYDVLAALGTLTSDYNYGFSFTDGVFTITQRPITVSADSLGRFYGDSDPALTYQLTSGNLAFSDAFSGALTRAAGENVGNYGILQGTLSAGANYALTYVGGNLQISQRALTVLGDSFSRPYGDSDPLLSYQVIAGNLVFGDAFSGALTRTAGENIGAYDIQQGTLTAGSNYALTYQNGMLQITPRAISVTADSFSRLYGDSDPALTYQLTAGNLVFGDTLSGALTRAVGENVGNYAILQGALSASPNYALSYVAGNLQITQRAVTVTADSFSRTYGESDPALTYQISSGNLAFSDAFTGALTRNAGENVGNYDILQGALTLGSNYALSYVAGNLQITQRAVTVTADSFSRTYGDSDPALTYQVTSGNLVFGDAFAGALTRVAGENVGNYGVLQGALTAGSNYALTYVGGNLQITQRAISVTADSFGRTYGDADPAFTYAISSGDLVFGDTFSGALTRAAGENVGVYDILQGTLTAGSNYALTYANGALQITPRAITVSADSFGRAFGDADPAFTYAVTSGNLAFSDALSGALTRESGEDVGVYAITQGALQAGSNYVLTFVNGALTIAPRGLTITADSLSRTYGDADPALTYQISAGNLAFGDSIAGALTRASGENVGSYTIHQGTLTAGSNYAITYVAGLLQITQRAISVTADSFSRTYGDADPAFSYAIASGNLAFSDALTGALTRAAGEDVGNYAILQGGLTAGSNYALTYVGGNLQITQRAIRVTADSFSRVYGAADPGFTNGVTAGDLVFGDTLSGALTRVSGENVGNYAIEQGTLGAGSNYALTYVGGNLQITPRAITVAADNLDRLYGDSDPALTQQIISGNLVFGDTLSGALSRAAGENVGAYAILQGTLNAGSNYTLTYVDGALQISPRPITLTANSLGRVYGDADPALTYAITSGNLAFSDVVTGALTRTSGENVGNYAILQGALTAGSNYALTYVAGNLQITPRALTVTANDQNRVYGNADPALTFAVTAGNLAFSDTLSGALTRTAGENVGSHGILQGSLTAGSNYALTYAPGALTITPRPIIVTALDAEKFYADPDPAFGYAVTTGNLMFGDTLAGALTRTPGESIGLYTILQGALGNANYAIAFVNGEFEILPLAMQPSISLTSPAGGFIPFLGTLAADTFFSAAEAQGGVLQLSNCPEGADGACVAQ